MKKFKKILTNRISMVALASLIEAAWMISLIIWASDEFVVINIGFRAFSVLMFLYAYHTEWHPDYRLAWTVIILAFPIGGGILYFSFGNAATTRRIRKKLSKTTKELIPYIPQDKAILSRISSIDRAAFGIANYLGKTQNFPAYSNTLVRYYPSGEDIFPDMIKELKAAKRFIFMEYFIVDQGEMWNQVFDILIEKAKEGLDVRFMYDDFGCVMTMPPKFYSILEEKGIKAACFNELRPFVSAFVNNRDHRKMTIIDGNVAINGGFNLADEYINKIERFGYWKDSGVIVRGDAVESFTYMFLSVWNAIKNETTSDFYMYTPDKNVVSSEAQGFVQPFTDSPLDTEPVAVTVISDMINAAQDYVYLTTPYLIPDSYLLSSLKNAARRGVDVRIITPGIPDKKMAYMLTKSYYYTLLEAGVKIFQFAPGFIHAKNVVCDDKMAMCSTINLDYRSLFLHFECGTLFMYNDAVDQIKQDMLKTFEVCDRQFKMDVNRNVFMRLFMSVLRVFAPLF